MKPLKKIYIEVTNRCNLHCSFCAVSQKAPATMSAQDFGHIARQVQPYTDYVCLHVKGEPLLHPQLKGILDCCKQHRLAVNLTTNGTLLAARTQLLCSAAALRQVNISLHAETDDPERYFSDAVAFARAAAAAGIYVSFRLWNGKEGQEMQQKLYTAFPNYREQGGRITLSNNIFLSLDSLWKWPDPTDALVSHTGTCYGLRHQIGILADGTVVPCCLDGEGAATLGNVLETPFADLWEPAILPHRTAMQNGKLTLPLCTKCHFREKFSK